MFGFLKKKKVVEEKLVIPCNHKWVDFHWYIKTYNDPNSFPYEYVCEILEPYVCIYCKQRRDESLMIKRCKSYKSLKDMVEDLTKQYSDKIKPKVEIEDAIKDMQLVDREFLRFAQIVNPNRFPIT